MKRWRSRYDFEFFPSYQANLVSLQEFGDAGLIVGLRCPDEGLWILIVAVDVFSDGHDELFEVPKDSAPEPVLGEVAEEAPTSRSCTTSIAGNLFANP